MATPLFAVLVVVETTDIMFAIDSIPAIFAITTDPFIVLSSNLFAILGLRALYFLLAGMIDKFVYLKQGLSALLVFAGAKILVADVYKMPIPLTLGVIVGILAISIVASVIAARRQAAASRILTCQRRVPHDQSSACPTPARAGRPTRPASCTPRSRSRSVAVL